MAARAWLLIPALSLLTLVVVFALIPRTERLKPVEVYFGSTVRDPQVEHCDLAYAISRQVVDDAPQAVLEELLTGVTDDEARAGFFTSINEDVSVNGLIIDDGVATVEFSENFSYRMAGSCRVAAVRAQIEQTLKQFKGVDAVLIKVEGQPDEEVLQP